jgi:hypothetical protein
MFSNIYIENRQFCVVMKAVDIDFKKADVVDYYSQLDQVKVRVLFSDGKEKALVRQFSITDPAVQATEILSEIRSKLKEQHKVFSLDDHPLAGALILRFRQEEDVLHEKLSRFLAQTRERIRSGKLAKLSYFDLEKKIVGFSTKFD